MVQVGNYIIKDRIAEGGCAWIYQAEHVYLKTSACLKQTKVISQDYRDLLKEESRILWKLYEHHSIPHAKDYFELPDGNAIMVMSYIQGKTLEDLKPKNSRLHPEDACWITERLLEALYYAHYNGVIHGDIKPANVIVETKKHDIKLIDFGLSVSHPHASTKPLGYSEAFVPPEILAGKPPLPETDLFGAGVVLLYGLGGDPITRTIPDFVPKPLAEYCSALLRYDPMERPNWEKNNLIKELSDIRQEVFGRRRTGVFDKTP